MKILVGVCGIGKGHCVRQAEICQQLIKRGHNVQILTFGNGVPFFQNLGMKVYDVFVPYITYKAGKINIGDVLRRNIKVLIPGIIKNWRVIHSLHEDLFFPDICISDYEPVTARISYLFNVPLITIDQQSKFMYMKTNSIDGYSCMEEKKRLNFFLPRACQRFIFSFYKLNDIELPDNVNLLYPILRKRIIGTPVPIGKDNVVVVYFSQWVNLNHLGQSKFV